MRPESRHTVAIKNAPIAPMRLFLISKPGPLLSCDPQSDLAPLCSTDFRVFPRMNVLHVHSVQRLHDTGCIR